jgi:twitching motility protein PilT
MQSADPSKEVVMESLTDNSFANLELSTHTITEIDPADLLTVLSTMKEGMVIYSGLTGTGKSYSQVQFLNHLNETQHLRIFTVEDPIEYVYTPVKSQIEQYEVGSDVPDFAKGANILANAHPDVLQISEIRDSETAAVAVEAALEMLIVTSLHASGAEDVYQRIVDSLPLDEVEDLLDDLAVLPIVVIHHENRKITKVLKLDPRS